MKKFLSLISILAIFSFCANAQEKTSAAPVASTKGVEKNKEERQKRFENASPEQKAKMEKRHEMMKSLSPEKREAVKKEMERHRAEIKNITGFDGPEHGDMH